ncbi:hypothetical protein [Fructobacillus papyrifericola]|uniref:Uncharacterized protein n=1 Tax=Fructobacillus papyrifericola TaxID=2713172 RepID=A0ABS5QT35_9LACO|nr:hypothetical protein [Fructobacillus papyrifericola]MBS9336358.1 hypothetical protein [Fructobacillus papyrifericola]
MKNTLIPTLIGTVVYFLVIHFWLYSGDLRMDLFSAALFFLILTGINAYMQHRSRKQKENK